MNTHTITNTTPTTIEIEYNSKYQPKEILETLLDDTSSNFHLLKPTTGSGATHGLFNASIGRKLILVSPNIQIVKDKEKDYRNGKFNNGVKAIFLYGNSKDSVIDAIYTNPTIIMCTIDKAIALPPELLNNRDLVIDEIHVSFESAFYRGVYGEPFEELVTKFAAKNRVLTITATKVEILPDYLKNGFKDVILTNKMINSDTDVVYIRGDRKTTIGLTRLIEETDNNLYFFTNDWSIIKSVDNIYYEHEKNFIVGSNLHGKIVSLPINTEIDTTLSKVTFISAAGTEGISINDTDGIIILYVAPNTPFNSFSSQKIVQSLGRLRGGFKQAWVIVDDKKIEDILEPKTEIKTECTNYKYGMANRKYEQDITLNFDKLKKYVDRYEYKLVDITELEALKIDESPTNGRLLPIPEIISNIFKTYKTDKEVRYNGNIVLDMPSTSRRFVGFSDNLYYAYAVITILDGLKLNREDILEFTNSFDKEDNRTERFLLAFRKLLYIIGYNRNSTSIPKGIKFTSSTKPYNMERSTGYYSTNDRPNRATAPIFLKTFTAGGELGALLGSFNQLYVLKQMVIFRNLSNYEHLPTVLKAQYNSADYVIKLTYKIESSAAMKYLNSEAKTFIMDYQSQWYITDKGYHNDMLKKYFVHHTKELEFKDVKYIYPGREYVQPDVLANQILLEKNILVTCFNDKDFKAKFEDFTGKTIRKELKQMGGVLLSWGKSGILTRDSRQYSALTSLPIDILKKVFPFKVEEYDIKGAFPTILSALLEQPGLQVYNNIGKARNWLIKDVKVPFNGCINATILQWPDKMNLLEDAGFTKENALIINNLNIKSGDMFRFLTKYEQKIIEQATNTTEKIYTHPTSLSLRRHDSLVIFHDSDDNLRAPSEFHAIIMEPSLKHDQRHIIIDVTLINKTLNTKYNK